MNEFIVECRGLSKSFESAAESLHVLRSLDLCLPKGVSCAIMGSSGSGKSTLLSILGGLEKADSGWARVGDFDLASLSGSDMDLYRSRGAGFVFQFHYLLKDFTALENVALPAYLSGVSRKEAWDRAGKLLDRVGLSTRLDHYPSELSGGERQRAAIARALINGPSILLADEPTGNLDAENAASVRELLYGLPQSSGTTLILATHDPVLADAADMSFTLSGGRLEVRS